MDDAVEILVNRNGPLRISGKFIIKDPDGNSFDLSGREVILLCRCGHSNNKPFCDGSHKRVGFESIVQARKLPPPAPKPVQQ